MEEKITFGKFISTKRKEAGLTQRDLAELLYVTESAVSKWERGLSYPDITLVAPLCEALHVTEHELITSSDDVYYREIERQAKNFKKIRKSYLRIFYIMSGLSLVVCFICNIAIQHTLSWFWVVFASLAITTSLFIVPVITEKRSGLWTLTSFYVSLNLLFIICRILFGGDWLLITMTAVLFGFAVVFLPYILRQFRLPHPVSSHKAMLCIFIDTVLLFVFVSFAVILSGEGGLLLKYSVNATFNRHSIALAYWHAPAQTVVIA